MKFSEEMKMLLQLQQLTKQNNPNVDIIREDYDNLLKTLLDGLKSLIRNNLVSECYPVTIEGDYPLPRCPEIRCKQVPGSYEQSELYSYTQAGGVPVFHWAALCEASAEGRRFAAKTVQVTLTAAGERFTKDLTALAEAEGLLLTAQPAVQTKNGAVLLPDFGTPQKIAGFLTDRDSDAPECFVSMHYLIQ